MQLNEILILILFFLVCITSNTQTQKSIDTIYKFKAKLIVAISLTPDCGNIAWAIVQKFQVISTGFINFKDKYVIVIQSCPEFLGKHFFKRGKVYEMEVATNSGAGFDFIYANTYAHDKIPTFWSRKIHKTN